MITSNVVEIQNTVEGFQHWLGFLLSFILLIVSVPSLKSILLRMENRKKVSSFINKFPGPPTLPFFGNAHLGNQIMLRVETEYFNWSKSMVKNWGPIIRFWRFDTPIIFIASSDIAIQLLKKGAIDDKCEDLKNFVVAINGIGLIAYPPETHAKHKKFWSPFFNWRQIESSMQFMNSEALKLVGELDQFTEHGDFKRPCQEFDLLQYSIRCTFNIICCSAFGHDFMSTIPYDVVNQHIKDLHTVALNLTVRAFRPWLNSDIVYYNTPGGRETKQCAERGASLVKEAIAFRRKVRSSNNNHSDKENSCFLDRLLDLHEQGILNETQILGEINVFVVAGYDTSGIVISLVMFFLSIYPEHQEKVVQELEQVLGPDFGSNNVPLTWDNLKEFKHLELCVKESLRLYPLVPALPRRTTKDVKLEDGKVIPRDVDVFVFTNIIHQDPNQFEDPEAFKPERHSGAPIPAFMPFSFGNRNCIGQVYGMVTVKTIVAHLLKNFRWETTETKEGFKTLYQTIQVPVSVKCRIIKRTLKNAIHGEK